MASHDDLGALNCHQTSDVIPGNLKTFTFHCRNVVIRLTCNEPSKEAAENSKPPYTSSSIEWPKKRKLAVLMVNSNPSTLKSYTSRSAPSAWG